MCLRMHAVVHSESSKPMLVWVIKRGVATKLETSPAHHFERVGGKQLVRKCVERTGEADLELVSWT
jgi:hypothetical protein